MRALKKFERAIWVVAEAAYIGTHQLADEQQRF